MNAEERNPSQMWILWILYQMDSKSWWEKLGDFVCPELMAASPHLLLTQGSCWWAFARNHSSSHGDSGDVDVLRSQAVGPRGKWFLWTHMLKLFLLPPQTCLASTVRQLKPGQALEAKQEGGSLLGIRNRSPRGCCEPAVCSMKSGSGLGFLAIWSDKISFLFASHPVTLRHFRTWRNDLSNQCFFPQW